MVQQFTSDYRVGLLRGYCARSKIKRPEEINSPRVLQGREKYHAAIFTLADVLRLVHRFDGPARFLARRDYVARDGSPGLREGCPCREFHPIGLGRRIG
jgi:hypothetical protein